MILFYQIIICILTLLLYPLAILHPRYKYKLSERLGKWDIKPGNYIWFHGASVGEIQGLIPLITLIKIKYPEQKILGTATSGKGRQLLEKHADYARLLPIDSGLFINRALKEISVSKFIFGETEIWPGLIAHLSSQNIPIIMINARISEINYQSYIKLKSFISATLFKISKIYAIDQENAERLISLGAKEESVKSYGNLKYDRQPKICSIAEAQSIKNKIFNRNQKIIVLGNIRPGEETFWFDIINDYKNYYNFIIAPRHSEKFSYFAEKLKVSSIDFDNSSQLTIASNKSVILLDEFGKLEDCYSFASISFTGGTLIPGLGGHSPMESAAYGNLLLSGPHYLNQKDCISELKKKDAIIILKTKDEISAVLRSINSKPEMINEYGSRAQGVWSAYQGLTKNIFHEIFNA